jgi:hypothetical protein
MQPARCRYNISLSVSFVISACHAIALAKAGGKDLQWT